MRCHCSNDLCTREAAERWVRPGAKNFATAARHARHAGHIASRTDEDRTAELFTAHGTAMRHTQSRRAQYTTATDRRVWSSTGHSAGHKVQTISVQWRVAGGQRRDRGLGLARGPRARGGLNVIDDGSGRQSPQPPGLRLRAGLLFLRVVPSRDDTSRHVADYSQPET